MIERTRRCKNHFEEPTPTDPDAEKNKPLQERIWNFLEQPASSKAANRFAFISFSFVVLSIVTSVLETIPFSHEEPLGYYRSPHKCLVPV